MLSIIDYLSHLSQQRDDHDDTHELCEEDERSEEGPNRPQCNVKAAEKSREILSNGHWTMTLPQQFKVNTLLHNSA